MVNINGPLATRSGTADINAVYRGRHISIEIKVGKDRQSERQKLEAERITKAGGLYIMATDMQSFIEWWDQTFN